MFSTRVSSEGGLGKPQANRKQNSREATPDSQTQQRKMCAAAWRRQASVSGSGSEPCMTVKILKEMAHPKDRSREQRDKRLTEVKPQELESSPSEVQCMRVPSVSTESLSSPMFLKQFSGSSKGVLVLTQMAEDTQV